MDCFSGLFDFSHSVAGEYIKSYSAPWLALKDLKEFILSQKNALGAEYVEVSPFIWVHKSAKISNTASIMPPCVIGAGSEIRHCAFIRGSVIVGENCVVGNSVELKNSILFDGVQTPHFNYVGDSILGFRAHFGAGAITSNVKADKSHILIDCNGEKIDTGLKKLGALVGDFAEIGCNSVLNPATVIGKNTTVYPLSNVRGFVPSNSILKGGGLTVQKR